MHRAFGAKVLAFQGHGLGLQMRILALGRAVVVCAVVLDADVFVRPFLMMNAISVMREDWNGNVMILMFRKDDHWTALGEDGAVVGRYG